MRICECFRSIQGEGLMMGMPTVFVRTVGCNLSCSWCDTRYSMEGGVDMSVDEILAEVGETKHVCVTGGEPMLQPEMPDLLRTLLSNGKHVVLETNGSVDLSEVPSDPSMLISMDIKCPSSGMTDRMLLENLGCLSEKDQLKFIVADDADFDFAVRLLQDNPVKANLIFGPVGGTVHLEWLVGRVLESGLDARVLPQLHKIIWGDRRSV
ncbi:MAG: radical SAM protein [Candidatus Methanomethylophilaceae archaeon]|nr:radical SAM protein [Candidatus Methanomethylophilaceae archaeon]